MSPFRRLAIIGVGPSAIYFLQHLLREIDHFRPTLDDVYLFDTRAILGIGMPYDRNTTDEYNLCNISSAEIPPLHQSLVSWLHSLSDERLAAQGIVRSGIDEDETYRRTTLGDYFHVQYLSIVSDLRARGIAVHEMRSCTVRDVIDHRVTNTVDIRFGSAEHVSVDRVVIATGHSFGGKDEPGHGYFASPWPMQKLIPDKGHAFTFEIGTLGASLSAFDVVSSLAHRHGAFLTRDDELAFVPFPGTDGFRLVLHSSEGWLPHLQYEQMEPFRIVYRHVDRDTMLSLRGEDGFLALDDYFDHVCRSALAEAFEKDGRADLVELLRTTQATLETFVQHMSDEHTAEDPFALMRLEMQNAKRSLRKGIPIHWKETLDDLMYTLNFHYELLSAEDHLRYRKVIAPFLMNVIAAMPLHSANILLALHDAGCLDLVPGKVSIKEKANGHTRVAIENGGRIVEHSYAMFIDCSGQGALELDAYPFPSMAADGTVSEAIVYFRDRAAGDAVIVAQKDVPDERDGRAMVRAGGVAIDGYYRVVGRDGVSNERIHDVAFPHTTGVRPYSYGLQACDAVAAIVVQSWRAEADNEQPLPATIDDVTEVYVEVPEPSGG